MKTLSLLAGLAALTTVVHQAAAASQDFEKVDEGRYLAVMGDCVACHTAPGGKPLAGGLPMQTPFGTIVTPNITPDRDTGIGAWTDAQFIRAMREGIGADGSHLYPAFPYPNFTRLDDHDLLALRAYLDTVEPVNGVVEVNQLPWPFSMRMVMIGWNMLEFDEGRFKPDPGKSAEWNRGAWIVDGLGHCGTCHTPRSLIGGDKASEYLQGGVLQGWFAPELSSDPRRGLGSWSVEEVVAYLKTGDNGRAVVSGPMTEVVENSTSKMNDADLHAVAVYLKDQPGSGDADARPLDPRDAAMKAGAALYADNCAACHTPSGEGISRLFPALKGSAVVQSKDTTTLSRLVLQGVRAGGTADAPTRPAMPAFGWRLTDAQVADVVTYIRNAWGNAAPAAKAGDVKDLRDSLP